MNKLFLCVDTYSDNEIVSNAYRVILSIDMGIISNLYFKQFIFCSFSRPKTNGKQRKVKENSVITKPI